MLKFNLPTNTPLFKLVPLIVPIVILSLSDSILSYTAPIYADKLFNNGLLAGIAISFSSFIGFLFDFSCKKLFGSKNFSFFLKTSFILSVLFSYMLGLSLVHKYIFFFAMAAWGIYYETMAFSSFKYLKNHVESSSYSVSWGLITMMRSLVYGIGPLVATFLLSYRIQLPALICGTFVLIEFLVYLAVFKNPRESVVKICVTSPKPEIKVWKTLFKRVYPILILNFVLLLTDAGFWTAGVILSEKLGQQSPMGKLLMTIYMLPAVFVSPLAPKFSGKLGKKRTAIISSFIASIFLVFMGTSTHVTTILLMVLIYASLTAITYPSISATFEDYIKRLGDFDTDLIGLEQSSISLAYIVGPALAGLISIKLGGQAVFTIFGLLLTFTSLAALIVTPRKIKMPQTELSNLA